MKQKTIYILSILFTALVILGIILMKGNVFAKAEPIQELLNQIQINESELKQIEIRQNELNEQNEQAKERLLNEYGLQISEKEETIFGENRGTNVDNVPEERYPGKITEDGTHQEMPEITGDDSHERFKDLSNKYGLDPSMIRNIENHYGIKEGVVLCITIAETSGCKKGAGEGNCGNVGNNDRGDRVAYATIQTSIEKIGMTLNNSLLGKKQTLGCLSNWNHCQEQNDNGKRYATSSPGIGHREPNMIACLEQIYGEGNIDPATFSIRR